jgi:hypothetical protein
MIRLEDLQPNASIRGILPNSLVTVVSVQWFGSEALELTYKTPTGKVANELLYRHDEPRLELVEHGRPWSLDSDGDLFRLVSEAQRIHLAHLFDPVTLDPTRVGRDASRIAEEVIAHLVSLVGGTVIEAEIPSGAPDQVVRTVTENCRTLKFTSQGFEIE